MMIEASKAQIRYTLLAVFVAGLLTSLSSSCVPRSETARRSADDLRFDVVATEGRGEYVHVKVKLTNVSRQHVNQAKVTCVLNDNTGREIVCRQVEVAPKGV